MPVMDYPLVRLLYDPTTGKHLTLVADFEPDRYGVEYGERETYELARMQWRSHLYIKCDLDPQEWIAEYNKSPEGQDHPIETHLTLKFYDFLALTLLRQHIGLPRGVVAQ